MVVVRIEEYLGRNLGRNTRYYRMVIACVPIVTYLCDIVESADSRSIICGASQIARSPNRVTRVSLLPHMGDDVNTHIFVDVYPVYSY
jgi:hypothetical protein